MAGSFIFYNSFYESIKYLQESEQIKVYSAIMEYALYENEIELDGAAKALFIAFKPQIDANAIRRENGFKGGRPPKITDPKPNNNQDETKTQPNVNLNLNVNENDNANWNGNESEEVADTSAPAHSKNTDTNINKINNTKFSPPDLYEVRQYCYDKNYIMIPEDFVDYYNSNGWKVGRNPMKDWQSSADKWERSEKIYTKHNSSSNSNGSNNGSSADIRPVTPPALMDIINSKISEDMRKRRERAEKDYNSV